MVKEEKVLKIKRLLERARRPIDERSRKEMSYHSSRAALNSLDYRKRKRGSWDSFID